MRVLYLVQAGRRHGIGHLVRVLRLAQQTPGEVLLLIEAEDDQHNRLAALCGDMNREFCSPGNTQLPENISRKGWQLIVVDRRQVSPSLIRQIQGRQVPLVVWDGYGTPVSSAEILINPLFYHQPKKANLDGLMYHPAAPLPPAPTHSGYILISLGGSDPSRHAERIALQVLSCGRHCVLVEGPLSDYSKVRGMPGLEVIQSPESMGDLLVGADMVITGVGATLAEALQAGRPCLVFSQSAYHQKIAMQIKGIVRGGMLRTLDVSALSELLDLTLGLPLPLLVRPDSRWWPTLIQTLAKKGNAWCPLCGSRHRLALKRTETETLFYCRTCASNYRYNWGSKPQGYGQTYFEEHYQDVYGQDYLADAPRIRSYSQRRLDLLEGLGLEQGHRILDFGCALGIFLDEARMRGYQPQGVEISPYARKRAGELFNIPSSPDWGGVADNFDAITAWFTLEHIADPEGWLTEAYRRLRPGGLLALGLPHGRGALARYNPVLYNRIRPQEHEFEPSLRGIKQLLYKKGFSCEKTVFFGLHPDRAGLPDTPFFRSIQKILGLGDTFEIYARKTHTPPADR